MKIRELVKSRTLAAFVHVHALSDFNLRALWHRVAARSHTAPDVPTSAFCVVLHILYEVLVPIPVAINCSGGVCQHVAVCLLQMSDLILDILPLMSKILAFLVVVVSDRDLCFKTFQLVAQVLDLFCVVNVRLG